MKYLIELDAKTKLVNSEGKKALDFASEALAEFKPKDRIDKIVK